nr:uncharacterized protein LOC128693055 [Cherax quadricarinatus]
MDLWTLLVVSAATFCLGHCNWPPDCEVTQMSEEWTERPLPSVFLLRLFPDSSDWELNITLSGMSQNCILSEKCVDNHHNVTVTCNGTTHAVQNFKVGISMWREIQIITTIDSSAIIWIVLSDSKNHVISGINQGLKQPIFIKLSFRGDADVVINCPQTWCHKGNKRLVSKNHHNITSYFFRGGHNFTGVQVNLNTHTEHTQTNPRAVTFPTTHVDNLILDSSHFNPSLWNQVYVVWIYPYLMVWVNGLASNHTIFRLKNINVESVQVLGEGGLQWCDPEHEAVNSGWQTVVCYSSCTAALLLLLLHLVYTGCVAYWRGVLANAPSNTATSATEHIYEEIETLEMTQRGPRL